MRMDIRSRSLPNPTAAEERARRSLAFALGRFSNRIARVAVTIESHPSERGSDQSRCRVRVSLLDGGDPLVVDLRDSDVFPAIDRAADRLRRKLSRQLSRRTRRATAQ